MDLLGSHGKQVIDLYNLRGKLSKLSPSKRRDELLSVIEAILADGAGFTIVPFGTPHPSEVIAKQRELISVLERNLSQTSSMFEDL
jgi:hypothetical protein